jgi:hypothetical protein
VAEPPPGTPNSWKNRAGRSTAQGSVVAFDRRGRDQDRPAGSDQLPPRPHPMEEVTVPQPCQLLLYNITPELITACR